MKGNVLVLGPKLGIMIYRFSELHDVGAYSVTTYIEGRYNSKRPLSFCVIPE